MYSFQAKITDRDDLDNYTHTRAFMFHRAAKPVDINKMLGDFDGVSCDEVPRGRLGRMAL